MKGILSKTILCSFFVSGILGYTSIKAASDNQIQAKAQQIFREVEQLVSTAQGNFDKLLYGSYQKDRLTFKDFVRSLKGLCGELEQKVLYHLAALHSEIRNDSGLSKALSMVQSVATEIAAGLKKLCKDLHPYETTKDTGKGYTIAKIIDTNIKGFLSKEPLNRYKSCLDEVILILTKKTVYSALIQELKELQKALDTLSFNNCTVTQEKILNLILMRIRKN